MSGLKNTGKRLWNFQRGKGYMTNEERRGKAKQKELKRLNAIYEGAEMPDEEVIRRNERRKAASRRGSRLSTVMTGDDTLG